ncbi:MAG: hypothetical protein WKG07_12130 [Hymenobacter sp.]
MKYEREVFASRLRGLRQGPAGAGSFRLPQAPEPARAAQIKRNDAAKAQLNREAEFRWPWWWRQTTKSWARLATSAGAPRASRRT